MNGAKTNFKYTYGLSFPGLITESSETEPFDFRQVVKPVADLMKASCANNEGKVLYDHYHLGRLARHGLDEYLPEEYRLCELVVVFLCKDYAERTWCTLEWKTIKELVKDPDQRHRVMFLWRGERDNEVLNLLELDWCRDGFLLIDELEPMQIWDEVHKRYMHDQEDLKLFAKHQYSNPSVIFPSVAAAIGLPSTAFNSADTIRKPFQRLALILLSPQYQQVLYGYAEEDRYALYCYVRSNAHEVYEPFDLGVECQFIDIANSKRDWAVVAQALAAWANESSRCGPMPMAELFLPCELLHELVESDFLNVKCYPDSGDEFLKPISLASLCPLVVRPLDRYLHPALLKNIVYLQRKYDALSAGKGKWIHGADALSDALIARRDIPEDVAIRMLSDLPPVSNNMVDWLKTMIGSMVPVALWWSVPGNDGWETHLLSYKSVCETRSLLEIGPAGEVTMLSSDLDHLALQRKRLHHKPHARSLLLMIDNPDLVPDLLASPPASGSSTPSYSVRSMS
jgi:hypothetical protein